jgi:hypothetical protein
VAPGARSFDYEDVFSVNNWDDGPAVAASRLRAKLAPWIEDHYVVTRTRETLKLLALSTTGFC